jgi:hypothetical protein
MANPPDPFRNFGILPENAPVPPTRVRADFSTGTLIGQYVGGVFLSAIAVGIAVLCWFVMPFPGSIIFGALIVLGWGVLLYLLTRNDYAWVELDGTTLRAKHLYTGQLVERPLREVKDLFTHILPMQLVAAVLIEAWLGRIRGVVIRFRDGKTPLYVSRADPAMRNARELIQAIVYRMGQIAPLDAEVVDLEGAPLVRRVFWKEPDSRE